MYSIKKVYYEPRNKYLTIVTLVLLFSSTLLPIITISNPPQMADLEVEDKYSSTNSNWQESFEFSKYILPSKLHTRSNGEANNTSASMFDPRTEYLIITPQEFISTLEPLAAWKHQKGVYTRITTLDDPLGINSTYSGSDLGEKIQAYLRDYHDRAQNLRWLLLVGDADVIPVRSLLVKNVTGDVPGLLSDYCPSDYYYSALDTSWDLNSNYIYGETGEEDWTPELYVGRLPVNNITEVEGVVKKILTYEQIRHMTTGSEELFSAVPLWTGRTYSTTLAHQILMKVMTGIKTMLEK